MKQAWEVSLDVCLEAGNLGETLKCAQTLALTIYPSMESPDIHDQRPAGASAMAVLLLCHASLQQSGAGGMSVNSLLRSCPRNLLRFPATRWALCVLSSLAAGDNLRLLSLFPLLPRRQQLVLMTRAREAQIRGMMDVCAAYRNVGAKAASKWLCCQPGGVAQLLKTAADR